MKLNKYYFTFGCGQQNAGRVQPIMASSMEEARERMIDAWGHEWSFSYTEDEWLSNEYCTETELPTI